MREPAGDKGYDALAAAHSRALARMSQDIADAIRGARSRALAGRRRGSLPESTLGVRAKLNEFVVNLGWESETAPAAIYQEVIQIVLQFYVVVPQAGDGVRDSRNALEQGQRLDFRRKAGCPLGRSGQLLVERLRPAPVPGIRG